MFTARSGNAELSLISGDLDAYSRDLEVAYEVKNATLDFEIHWNVR